MLFGPVCSCPIPAFRGVLPMRKVKIAAIVAGLLLLPIALSLPIGAADSGSTNVAPALPAPTAKAVKANYELAARWTPQKIGKLVFDISVTPHWLDTGDRFWYSYESNTGRRYYIVDPARKTKSAAFDPVKLAAQITMITVIPQDSQHLELRTVKFIRNGAAMQFDLNVPRDAKIPGETKASANPPPGDDDDLEPQPQGAANAAAGTQRTKPLSFEYDLAGAKLTMLPEHPPRKPRWASISPD